MDDEDVANVKVVQRNDINVDMLSSSTEESVLFDCIGSLVLVVSIKLCWSDVDIFIEGLPLSEKFPLGE